MSTGLLKLREKNDSRAKLAARRGKKSHDLAARHSLGAVRGEQAGEGADGAKRPALWGAGRADQINLQGVRPPQASSRLVLISKDAVSGWQGRASVVPRAEVSLAAGRWEPPSEV